MILSCPACATRYTISDAQLGPAGRTVRCSACKSTWHAEATDAAIELPLVEPVKEKVEDLKAVKADKLPLKYRAMVEDKKRAKAMTAQTLVWAGLGVAAVAILGLAYVLRVDIVKAFPRVAGAYAMAGIRTHGTALEFGANDAQAKLKGGRFVVTVKAQIKNTSNRPAPVPPVKVSLSDATLQVFDTEIMPGAGLIVPAHAMRTLVFDIPDPKNLAAHVDVRFDLEAMKQKPGSKAKHGTAHGKDSHKSGHDSGHESGKTEGHVAAPGAEEPVHGGPAPHAEPATHDAHAAPAETVAAADEPSHGALRPSQSAAEHAAPAHGSSDPHDAGPKLRPSVS